MANCIKCGSKSAVWSICNKEKVVEHFCDPCFKKFNLHEYKKEMDDFHRKKEEETKRQQEEKLKNNAEKSRKTEVKYQEGGFGEPYCSENCLSQAGREIFERRRNGTSGTCAFCQRSVYASLDNPGDCAFFPFKQKLFFICNNCVQKGKEHLKQINECCMCGKIINEKNEPSFVMRMSKEEDARDTEYMILLLYKERNNPKIPLEIRNFLNGKQKGNLGFSYDAHPSGGVNVTITLI